MVHLLNANSPLALNFDQPITTSRLAICSVILAEMIIFFILRLASILAPFRRTSEKSLPNTLLPSKLQTLVKKNSDKSNNNWKNTKEISASQKIWKAKNKIKVLDLLGKKRKESLKNQGINERVYENPLNKNGTKERDTQIEKQKKQRANNGQRKKNKKVIFQLQAEVNQFDSGTSSDSSSSSSSSDSLPETPRIKSQPQLTPANDLGIKVKDLKLSFHQINQTLQIMVSHSWVAFCSALLHFPAKMAAVGAVLHLMLVLGAVAIGWAWGKRSVGIKSVYGIIFVLNLVILSLPVLGILWSNNYT